MNTENNIDRSLTRLETATQLKNLVHKLQLANGEILTYLAEVNSNDDKALTALKAIAIKYAAKIANNAGHLEGITYELEDADKEDARKNQKENLMSVLLNSIDNNGDNQ